MCPESVEWGTGADGHLGGTTCAENRSQPCLYKEHLLWNPRIGRKVLRQPVHTDDATGPGQFSLPHFGQQGQKLHRQHCIVLCHWLRN